MTNVAFIVELFPPHIGGSERRYDLLTEWLTRHGFEVDVHTTKHDPTLPNEERRGSVRVLRYDIGEGYVRGAKRSLSGSLRLASRCLRIKASGDYDAYYLSEWPLVHSALSPLKRSETVQEWCEVLPSRGILILERCAALSSRHHVAVSEFTLARAQAMLGIRDISLVPNPLKLEAMMPLQGQRVKGRMVYAGRLMPHKHVDLLMTSLPMIRQTVPDAELHIVGSGPEGEALADMARRFEGVTMHGQLDDQDLFRLLSTANLFVLASEREGDGISALEAMAYGVPLLTARHPNNAAVRFSDEGAGLAVDANATEFANGAIKLLTDEELWARSSQKALEISRSRDIETVGRSLSEVLSRVASGN